MIELTLPEFDTDSKSTRDLVILLLLKNQPLNAKQVWYKVNRLFSRNISYQGVYKTLALLVDGEILQKGEIGYEISPAWIQKIKKFAQSLEQSCDKEPVGAVPRSIIS
jgi:DNA-binding PadR family transcriptional regulator